MKIGYWILSVIFLFCLTAFTAGAQTLYGTYEVSYIYNATTDNSNQPTGSALYNGVWTAPLNVALTPGSYSVNFVAGRITGNDFYDYGYKVAYDTFIPVKNPGFVYPATGYNGGTTDPLHGDPLNSSSWWSGAYAWVGASVTDGGSVGGIFDILPGQSLWLYWPDPWIYDNLGGTTLEIWQTAGGNTSVPEPATLLLLGLSLVGLAGVRRAFDK